MAIVVIGVFQSSQLLLHPEVPETHLAACHAADGHEPVVGGDFDTAERVVEERGSLEGHFVLSQRQETDTAVVVGTG